MTITLLPVDAVDPDTIRKLDVHESQMDFIASNEESLEELAERPECVGFAVMIEGAPSASPCMRSIRMTATTGSTA